MIYMCNFHTAVCERVQYMEYYYEIIQKTSENSWLWSWPHRKTSAPHPCSQGNFLGRAKLELEKVCQGYVLVTTGV